MSAEPSRLLVVGIILNNSVLVYDAAVTDRASLASTCTLESPLMGYPLPSRLFLPTDNPH
jgi:hypothetical protein